MFNTMEIGHEWDGRKTISKEVEWGQRLARFASNGQEVKAFCLAESVSEATFTAGASSWRQWAAWRLLPPASSMSV